jgi:hypothetical protein
MPHKGKPMIENNPLKQYFRHPAIYLRLPSLGEGYASDVVELPTNGELPVYPMTALDDIATKTPDGLFNGSSVVHIIKSCIPGIKDPWKITSVDIDAVLVAIRIASNGDSMEISSTCPACGEGETYMVKLPAILAQIKPGNFTTEFPVNDLMIQFKPLTYKEMTEVSIEQMDLQRLLVSISNMEDVTERAKKSKEALDGITKMTMRIITKTIAHIRTPAAFVDQVDFISEFLQNCDKKTFEQIKDHATGLKSMSEIKPIHIVCDSCKHEYDQPFSVDAGSFFG